MHSTRDDRSAGGPPPTVVLAAGEGRRMARMGWRRPKPALRLLGLSLAERVLAAFAAAGVRRFVVVLGHRAAEVRRHFERAAARRGCSVTFVEAPEWRLGNGASARAARAHVGDGRFLLTMSDHVVSVGLIRRVLAAPPGPGEVCLAVDRSAENLADLEDVTKVALDGDRIVAIGKGLERWHAADTGVFYATPALFGALDRAAARGAHGLSDGVGELARTGAARAIDVTGETWIDVDHAEAFRLARRRLLAAIGKGREDGYVSAWLNRRISRRISARLADTSISPNQLSVVSFAIACLGAVLLGTGARVAVAAGGVLVQLASILDGCDGEVARLKSLASRKGAWLDTLLDRYADLAIATGITLGYAKSNPGVWAWVLGLGAAVGFVLASYVTKEFALRYGRPYPNDGLNRLKRRDLRLFGIFLGALVGRPFEALVVLGALSHACVVGILLRGWAREAEPTAATG